MTNEPKETTTTEDKRIEDANRETLLWILDPLLTVIPHPTIEETTHES